MKKIAARVLWGAFAVTLIALAIIGVKILNANYEFVVEACVAAAGFLCIFVCSLIRTFGNKCPHCGKTNLDNGEYCSHCGKLIKK